MPLRLLVEGLDWGITEARLSEVFGPFGDLSEARIARDWETGRSRGFGWVTFAVTTDGEAARAALDGQKLAGKLLRVMVAPEQSARPAYRSADYGYTNTPPVDRLAPSGLAAPAPSAPSAPGPSGLAAPAPSAPSAPGPSGLSAPAPAAPSGLSAPAPAAPPDGARFRSADFEAEGPGPRADRRLYRSADFGYVGASGLPSAAPAPAGPRGAAAPEGLRAPHPVPPEDPDGRAPSPPASETGAPAPEKGRERDPFG